MLIPKIFPNPVFPKSLGWVRANVGFGALSVLLLGAGGPMRGPVPDPPRLVAKVEFALGNGASENRNPYLFEDVQGLAFGPGGIILVAVAQDNSVRVFTKDGQFSYQFGRKGQGPGDLDRPCCLSVARDGRVWLVDTRNRRLSVFRVGPSAAQFVKTIPLPEFASGLMNRVEWDAVGRAYLVFTFRSPATGQFGSLRVVMSETGQVVRTDTIPMAGRDSLIEQTVERAFKDGARSGRGVSVIAQPYGPRVLRAFGPGGSVALAISSSYGVELRDASLHRVSLLRRAITPLALTATEREKAERTLVAAAKSNEIPRSALRLTPPRSKTPLRALGYDLDGRLWVQRNVVEGRPNEADVYDNLGRWVQIVEWPADVSLSLWAIRGREGLGVRVDADGVEQPVKLVFR